MRGAGFVVLILLAGCSGPADTVEGTDTAPTDTVDEGPTLELVEQVATQPVDWSGHTKEGAWVCNDATGAGGCSAGQQVQPDGAFSTTLSYADNATAIILNLTWTPADASQTGLVFAVYGNVSGSGPAAVAIVSGASPLQVAVQDPGLVPDGTLSLSVWPQGKTPTGPSVFVDATQQPFTVEGAITTSDMVWVEVEEDV